MHKCVILMHMDKHRFHLVLPNDVWQRLKALAKRNRRPITQEIIIAILARLREDPIDNLIEDAEFEEDMKKLEQSRNNQ